MSKEFTDKDVDALLEATVEGVLDNVTIGAILRNFNGRLKKLEAKREPKAKVNSKPAPAGGS